MVSRMHANGCIIICLYILGNAEHTFIVCQIFRSKMLNNFRFHRFFP